MENTFDYIGHYLEGYAQVYKRRKLIKPQERGLRKPKTEEELWGLIDLDNNIIIPLEYEHVGRCVEGICTITKNKKWGFFDVEKGKIVIEPAYEWANNFENGIAPVKKNGFYAYINRKGELVTPFQYTDACNVGEVARISRGGRQGELDPTTFEETWY